MVKSVFGGAALSDSSYFKTQEDRAKLIDVLLANGVKNIDSARLYAGSEVAIGQLEKRKDFVIDTKLPGGFGTPGELKKDNVIKYCQESIERAKIDQFDIFYLHAPDPTVPFEETLEGINEVYKKGIFRRFGLSNFSAEQVQQVYDIAKAKGYPLPQVYQGNYNPVARHLETQLFPTLRKLGMHFYAYSPLAGGFLVKTAADLDAGAGRFNEQAMGNMYGKLYDNETMRKALIKWNEIAEKEGVTKAELAYRWVAYHSALEGDEDGVIFGASKIAQAEQTAQSLKKGKLSDEAVKGIEQIWESVKEVAPVDNYHSYAKKL
ncbi:NADP-dependent oxidoreductase domain-containing protein [Alternaria rosae]|uniref:NADP-dependent oxidoreductase domain-containing protein n=1 Tax=Alternaria rosae TaxID=1187941 RepID=UPI001E8DA107|nr:NADP-dependent oxidoreductase domain-containing protein [Alternaria rosae]KAH6882443.1 NADP-dependent oxidoreductase domain-containing protein [Alternaria rosae]